MSNSTDVELNKSPFHGRFKPKTKSMITSSDSDAKESGYNSIPPAATASSSRSDPGQNAEPFEKTVAAKASSFSPIKFRKEMVNKVPDDLADDALLIDMSSRSMDIKHAQSPFKNHQKPKKSISTRASTRVSEKSVYENRDQIPSTSQTGRSTRKSSKFRIPTRLGLLNLDDYQDPLQAGVSPKSQVKAFDAALCGRMLYGLRLGIRCVDSVILETLALCTYKERHKVSEEFQKSYGQNLDIWLIDLVDPAYHPLINMLLINRTDMIAQRLHDCLHDVYKHLDQIIEDLVLHSCVDLLEVKQRYAQLFGAQIEQDIEKACESEPRVQKFLIALCDHASNHVASKIAQRLDIGNAQADSTSNAKDQGFYIEAVEYFLSCSMTPYSWFAKKLRQHMVADDDSLLEIIISRKNIDLQKIDNDYRIRYGMSLKDAVVQCYHGKMTQHMIEIYLRHHLQDDTMHETKQKFSHYIQEAEKLRREIEGIEEESEPTDLPSPALSSPLPLHEDITSLQSVPLPLKPAVRRTRIRNHSVPRIDRRARPTVTGLDHFQPETVAAQLQSVFILEDIEDGRPMILSLLARAKYRQRVLIRDIFRTIYNEDICDKLRQYYPSEDAQLMMQLFLHPASIDAYYLRQAMMNFSLDEQNLILFLGHRYETEMALIQDSYETIFGRNLESDLHQRLEGKEILQDLFLSLLKGDRRWNRGKVNEKFARNIAAGLFSDPNEPYQFPIQLLIEILSKYSKNEIQAIFREYDKQSGHDIVASIMITTQGDIRKCLLGIIAYIRDPIEFTARLLHDALENGSGNKDMICYIIFSRAEHDLATVLQYYHMVYRRQFLDMIKICMPADVFEFLRHLCTLGHAS